MQAAAQNIRRIVAIDCHRKPVAGFLEERAGPLRNLAILLHIDSPEDDFGIALIPATKRLQLRQFPPTRRAPGSPVVDHCNTAMPIVGPNRRTVQPADLNLRLGPMRRLAYEAADCGLLSADPAADDCERYLKTARLR